MKKNILLIIINCLIFICCINNICFGEEVEELKNVEIGDYVTYTAGKWTREEINELISQGLCNYDIPEGAYRTFLFSGFNIGDSKDVNTNANGTYSTGWRILSKDDGIIKIISTGSTEQYYAPFGDNYAYAIAYELTGERDKNDNTDATENMPVRNWDMYENSEYAVLGFAHIPSVEEIYNITGSQEKTDDNLRNIGENYITSTVHCNQDMWTVEKNGYIDRWGDRVLGIRPVVYLKSTLKINKIGQSDDGYNIWKLINKDEPIAKTEENIIKEEYNATVQQCEGSINNLQSTNKISKKSSNIIIEQPGTNMNMVIRIIGIILILIVIFIIIILISNKKNK